MHLDEGKHGQMAFRTEEDRESAHRMAADTIFFPGTGYGGMIPTKLKVIWDMSVNPGWVERQTEIPP